MRRIRHSIRRCNADRIEREAYARLLAYVFAQELAKTPIHITSWRDISPSFALFIAATATEDPQLWN